MKFLKIIIFICAIFIFFLCPDFNGIESLSASYFSQKSAGTATAQFLKLGTGARAIGMGEAYTAVAEDADALYWNPAGLVWLKRKEAAAMYTYWFEDIYFANLTYAQPGLGGSFGMSLDYLCAGAIEMYDKKNNLLDEEYMPYDLAVTLSYAKMRYLYLFGLNFKYISMTIEEESARGWCIDAGMLREFFGRLNVGAVVKNLGPTVKFSRKSDILPLTLKLGLSLKMIKNRLILASDVNFPIDSEMTTHYGLEYTLKLPLISLIPRVGYKVTPLTKIDSKSSLSLGFGWKHPNYSVNYAWVPYWEYGDTHRLSINFRMGK
jgi:hypothetical protein